MPGCYATSIKALSGGKELPLQTTSNTQAWDKRRRQEEAAPEPTPAVAWDYEGGTLYALPQYIANTVYMGTRTCFDGCSELLKFYYPDGTGAPGEPNTETGVVKMAQPSETDPFPSPPTATATHDGEENSSTPPIVTASSGGGRGREGESTPMATATGTSSGSSGSGSQSADGDSGNQSGEPEDPAAAEPTNSQSPDVSLASRIRGEFTVGSCSIVALMIPLLAATLVL